MRCWSGRPSRVFLTGAIFLALSSRRGEGIGCRTLLSCVIRVPVTCLTAKMGATTSQPCIGTFVWRIAEVASVFKTTLSELLMPPHLLDMRTARVPEPQCSWVRSHRHFRGMHTKPNGVLQDSVALTASSSEFRWTGMCLATKVSCNGGGPPSQKSHGVHFTTGRFPMV